jgi:O-glycosyl hydrolase
MRRILLLSLLLLLSKSVMAQSCTTATCTATAATEAAFMAALPARTNRNATVVVNVPSGTIHWTTAETYTIPSAVTSLTIQGNTTVSCTGTAGTVNYACTPTDNTIFQDQLTSASPTPLGIVIGTAANTLFRWTGFTFKGGSGAVTKNQGIIDFYGGNGAPDFRMDHDDIILTSSYLTGPEIDGAIEGVFDHDVFNIGSNTTYSNGVRVYNHIFDTVGNGDGGFEAASDFGSSNFIFIESSQIMGGYLNDCADAGRMVERYNIFISPQSTMQNHPTKSYAGPERGCRAQEFYHNYVNGDSTFAVIGGQASTWLIWGNTVNSSNNTASWFWAGATYRNSEVANGEPTDSSPPHGWGYCGTAVATFFNRSGRGASGWDGNSSTATGYPCLDGLGRGQQVDSMNGANFPKRKNTTNGCTPTDDSGCSGWPAQYLEPIYLFDNTLPSALYTQEVLNQDKTTTLNRDIYADNTSCAGSGCSGLATGTGYGTFAQRPTTCTAGPGGTYGTSPTGSYGVGYFATDTGTLYVCTATNTWTAIYKPYTYPHPLVSRGACSVSSVTVTPSSATLTVNTTQQFSATVNYTGSCVGTVTWSVTGGDSISSSGLYTAPGSSASGIVVTATSTDNTSISGIASVTILPVAPNSTITWTSVNQIIDGFGVADAGRGASMSSANQTFFFNTTPPNIGLSLLRAGVTDGGLDRGSCLTVSTSCAGVYVSDMHAVIAAGGRVYASPWSPPAAYKTNRSTKCMAGSGSGALATAHYGAYATWLANFVQSLQTEDRISLYAISIQNEPDICQSYDSALWTASQMDTFIKTNLGPTFSSSSLSTLIFMPEDSVYSAITGSDGGTTCMEDSSCSAYVSGVNWHDYDAAYTTPDTVNATPYPSGWATGKKYWQTEVSPGAGGPTYNGNAVPPGCTSGVFCGNINEAMMYAAFLDDRLVNENANAYIYWCPIGSSCLVNSAGTVVGIQAYVMGQYSDFVRPGMYRIGTTHGPQTGVSVSAYKNTTSGAFAIVATNYNSSSELQQFTFSGATVSSVVPYCTTSSLTIAQQSAITVFNDIFEYTLPAQSVCTFTGASSLSFSAVVIVQENEFGEKR